MRFFGAISLPRSAWAVAALPPAVTAALLVSWLIYRQQEFDRLASAVRSAQTDIRNLPMLETHLDAARKSAIVFSRASSDISAEADLLDSLRSAAAEIGVTPQDLELLPAAELGAYHRIGASLHAVIDSDRLIAFFKTIEDAKPTLWIDNLSAASASGTASSLPASLNVAMSIYTLRCSGTDCGKRQ
jgi:hypothetical protein